MNDSQQILANDRKKAWRKFLAEGDRVYKQRDYAQATTFFQKTIELSQLTRDESYAISLTKLGLCYFSMKDYSKAESLLKEGIEIRKKIFSKENANYPCSLMYLACVYREKKQYSEAEKLFLEALSIFQKNFGKEHLYCISAVNSLALLYKQKKDYQKSENFLKYALNVLEKKIGKENISYNTALLNLASLYKEQKAYNKAEPLFLQALQFLKRFLGVKHPEYADWLTHLAFLYKESQNYKKAQTLFESILQIRKTLLGEQHPEYGKDLYHLGLLYYELKEYDKAEPFFLQSLEIQKSFLAKDNPLYLEGIQILGNLYSQKKEYSKAEMYFSEGLSILKKMGYQEHPQYPVFANNLALVYKNQQNYLRAETLLNLVLLFLEQTTEKNSLSYTIAKNNLAILYQEKEEYEKAEPLFLEVMEIYKEKESEKKENYAAMVNNLALLYQAKGDYTKAESFFFQALGIFELVFGKENLQYRTALNNLANLYIVRADYERAENLLIESLEITERCVGQYHLEYIKTLNNLAKLYESMGIYSKPEHLFRQALDIYENILGKGHPAYAMGLDALGSFYQNMGEYGKAENLFLQSMEIKEHSLGKTHPLYAASLHKLAWLKIAIKEPKEAIQLFLKAVPVENKIAFWLFSAGEEKKLETYLQGMEASFYTILSLFYQNYESLKNFSLEIYSLVLQRKRISQELLSNQSLGVEENGPEFQRKYHQWRETLQKLLLLFDSDICQIDWREYKKIYKEKQEEEAFLEKELSIKSPLFSLWQKLMQISPSMLALLLPPQSVIVEFVYLREIDLKTRKYIEPRYLAFLQKQNSPTQIETIELGEASQIENLIYKYKKQTIPGQRDLQLFVPKYSAAQTKTYTEEKEEDKEVTKMLLHATIFMPILTYIEEIKRLILAPDGMLSLLPFEILEDSNDHFLVEDYDISYVQTGKDLLRFTCFKKPQSRPLVVINPDFNMEKTNLRQTQRRDLNRIPGKRDYEFEQSLQQEDFALSFSPLPETQSEGRAMAKIFSSNCDIWQQEKSLDFKLKKIKAPKILHLATHCFYMQDAEKAEISSFINFWTAKGKRKQFANPLLRSGITVSGINTFLKRKEMSDDLEDGLLTSLDITGIHLFGTEVALLSLSETGSGKIKIADAFCSLIEAFLLAGVKNVIVSLWKMPENEKIVLLYNFYQKILSGKRKDQALREVQREIIQNLRDQNKKPSPYFWGGFVCVGDPN